MRDILLKILAAIEDLAPVGSVAASPDSRQEEPKDEPKEEPKEETKEEPVEEAPVETKSTRRASK